MLHELLKVWFGWVEHWGYGGVFILMAMESSIIPVPSEVVMPPAAFWAAQGKMSLWGVILAGTLGSYAGSVASYFAAQWVGLPLIHRYGKYFLLPQSKIQLAERWVKSFGAPGVFIARLLPVVRHLISIPAGVFHMPFGRFSAVTLLGAGLWCTVLSWWGQRVLGQYPALIQDPAEMTRVIRQELVWFVAAVALVGVLYGVVVFFKTTRARSGEI